MKNRKILVSKAFNIEGLDGSGKSSQIKGLCEFIEELGLGVVVSRQPGGTFCGEVLRDMMKHGVNGDVLSEKSTLLGMFMSQYNADEKTIGPATERGDISITDRFTPSTYAYQVYNNPEYKELFDLMLSQGDFTPNFTVFLDVSYEESCRRMGKRGEAMDEIELRNQGKESFSNLRKGYSEYLEKYQKNMHVIIDTTHLNEEQVLAAIIDKILVSF